VGGRRCPARAPIVVRLGRAVGGPPCASGPAPQAGGRRTASPSSPASGVAHGCAPGGAVSWWPWLVAVPPTAAGARRRGLRKRPRLPPPRRRRLSQAAGAHLAQRVKPDGLWAAARVRQEDAPGAPPACAGGGVARSPVRRVPVYVSGVCPGVPTGASAMEPAGAGQAGTRGRSGAEQGRTGDGLQPTLVPRFGFQPRLTPGVRARAAGVGGTRVVQWGHCFLRARTCRGLASLPQGGGSPTRDGGVGWAATPIHPWRGTLHASGLRRVPGAAVSP
jgi:hypothetical protein